MVGFHGIVVLLPRDDEVFPVATSLSLRLGPRQKYEAFCSVAAEGKAVAQSSNNGSFPMGTAAAAAGYLRLTTKLSTFYHLGWVVAIS